MSPLGVFRNPKVQKWMTIMGIAVLCSANGALTFGGNLLTYTNSYFLVKAHDDVTHVSATVQSSWFFFYFVSIIFSSKVTKQMRKSWSLLLGCALYDTSYVIGYWDVKESIPLFVITRGVMSGLGAGHMMAVSSGYLIEWTGGKNLGFLSSMALASTKGSIFMNLLITWYLNPGNLAPDLDQDRTKYFQQEQILDRVPSVFLVLAATFTTIHLCGFFMLSDLKSGRDVANDVEQNQIESLDPDVEPKLSLLDKRHFKKDNGIVYQPIRQHDLHDDDSLLDKDGDGYKDAETRSRSEVNLHLGTPPFQGSDIVYGKGQEAEEELLLKEFDEQEVENGQNEQQQKSTSSANAPTWRDAVRTKHFYVLWFASGSAIMANVIVSTFFKSFGQSLIKDDHFLSSIGTFMAAGLFVSRMIWGFVIDNTDLKSSLVSYYSILSLSGTFWIFTPHIGKWVFLMWTTLLASFAGGFHTVIYVSVYASFGGTNFTTIYGLVCCSGIIVTLFLPVVLSAILEHFSWSGLFFTMASGNIISLVLIVVYFPRKF